MAPNSRLQKAGRALLEILLNAVLIFVFINAIFWLLVNTEGLAFHSFTGLGIFIAVKFVAVLLLMVLALLSLLGVRLLLAMVVDWSNADVYGLLFRTCEKLDRVVGKLCDAGPPTTIILVLSSWSGLMLTAWMFPDHLTCEEWRTPLLWATVFWVIPTNSSRFCNWLFPKPKPADDQPATNSLS